MGKTPTKRRGKNRYTIDDVKARLVRMALSNDWQDREGEITFMGALRLGYRFVWDKNPQFHPMNPVMYRDETAELLIELAKHYPEG